MPSRQPLARLIGVAEQQEARGAPGMGTETVSGGFAEQVRDVLAHLFDPVRLQNHPLTAALVPGDVTDPRTRAQLLREAVLQAIADLKPPATAQPDDPVYRPYAIIRRRYADGFSREEVQRALSISRRQYFREQQRALTALTRLLWERRLDRPEPTGGSDDFDQLEVQARAFSLCDSARQAIAATRSLADRRGVGLSLRAAQTPEAYGDEAVTRQLIVGILSLLIQHYADRYVEATPESGHDEVRLTFTGIRRDGDAQLEEGLASLQRLAVRTSATVAVVVAEGAPAVRLALPPAPSRLVVVVEDNPRTIQLFERYLEPFGYRIAPVQESAAALEQVSLLRPDVVILDVMMQEVDGWQVLQSLKTDPRTRAIPVIVCSVLNEGELAATLGADGYLRKPVSQMELVLALGQVRPSAGGGPASAPAPGPASG